MTVIFGTPEEATAALFAKPSQESMNYIQQSVNRYMSMASALPPEQTAMVVNQYNTFTEQVQGHAVDAIRHQMENYWQSDIVNGLWTMETIQQAPDQALNWIMANPTIRELYHSGNVAGYGDRYVDHQPGAVGSYHNDYRRVTNNMVMHDDKGSRVSTYHEMQTGNDVMLSSMDKAMVMSTWRILDEIVEEDDLDPTSIHNNTIG